MEDMHLELKPGKTSDYEYTEAVKTLRTNIQFCGSSVRVIMFTSAIPSEGKSDLSFATAEALAQIGKRTLLIDADIRKSILTYRYQLKNKLNGLSQFLSGQKRLEEVLYTTSTRGLDLIFAGPFSPNPAELLEEELFGDTVKKLREAYDYIIIDCPPALGLMTLNVLTAADSVIIPIQAEFYALEGLSQLVKTIHAVTKNLNPDLDILGILLTMYDGRTNLSVQVRDEVTSYFGDTVFKTVIPRSVKLSEAPGFGQPITLYAPKSKGGVAYKKLSREVLKRVEK